jgi:excinuclease ABC subunit B
MQTSGRAARNILGRVIMYADKMTKAIMACIEETKRRRAVQLRYNEEHHITPESIKKSISQVLISVYEADYVTVPVISEKGAAYGSEEELPAMIRRLKDDMKEAARNLEFEKAAELRDQVKSLTEILMTLGGAV